VPTEARGRGTAGVRKNSTQGGFFVTEEDREHRGEEKKTPVRKETHQKKKKKQPSISSNLGGKGCRREIIAGFNRNAKGREIRIGQRGN